MIAPLILVAFAAIAGLVGGRLLLRVSWVHTSPHWGIWAWQALSMAVAGAIVLVPVTLAIPLLPISSSAAQILQTTSFHLIEHYSTPAGGWLALAALATALGTLARIVWLASSTLHRAAHARRAQLDALTLVGQNHPAGFVLVEHSTPFVYCLPGRRRRVVVTSRALELLTMRELAVVLAHERTHLRLRHDLALALSEALARTFVLIPLFRRAHDEITALIEMQADDAAQAAGDRTALARALVTLSLEGARRPAHAATHPVSLARIRRLTTSPHRPMRLPQSVSIAMATAVLISAPLGLALAPAVEAATQHCCTPD
jgi:Zn-dependent protease with chaperone function